MQAFPGHHGSIPLRRQKSGCEVTTKVTTKVTTNVTLRYLSTSPNRLLGLNTFWGFAVFFSAGLILLSSISEKTLTGAEKTSFDENPMLSLAGKVYGVGLKSLQEQVFSAAY